MRQERMLRSSQVLDGGDGASGLVSGASAGIGRATAALLRGRVHRCSVPAGPLRRSSRSRASRCCLFDVRDKDLVAQLRGQDHAARRTHRCPSEQSAASYAFTGAAEEASEDEVRAQFDTNSSRIGAADQCRAPRNADASVWSHRQRETRWSASQAFRSWPFIRRKFAHLRDIRRLSATKWSPREISVSLIEPGVVRTAELFANSGSRSRASGIADYRHRRRAAELSMENRVEKTSNFAGARRGDDCALHCGASSGPALSRRSRCHADELWEARHAHVAVSAHLALQVRAETNCSLILERSSA